MKINFNSKLSLNNEVLIQNLESEAVLLHLKSEEYFTLNENGTLIMNLLSESKSVREIYDRFLEEYDIEPSQFQQDLLNYIEELVQNDIVKVQEA